MLRSRTSIAAILLPVLILALGVLPAAGSARALPATVASCGPLKLNSRTAVQQRAEGAQAVFAAKVVSVRKARTGGSSQGVVQPKAAVWSHRIRVLGSFRGTARRGGSGHVVLTPMKAKAGAKLKVGATYLFFAQQQGDPFLVSRCDGAVQLHKGLSAKLRSTLAADLDDSTAAPADVHITVPRDGTRSLPALGGLIAPGIALVLIGLLGLLLVGRVARARQ